MNTERSSRWMLVIVLVGMAMMWCLQGHAADWEPMAGRGAPLEGGWIEVEVIEPCEGAKYWLPPDQTPGGAGPVILHRVRATNRRGDDVTTKLRGFTVEWSVEQEWNVTEPPAGNSWTWEFAASMAGEGKEANITYPSWGAYPTDLDPQEREGRILISATATYGQRPLVIEPDISIALAGSSPTHGEMADELGTDRLRAIAWAESEFHQFSPSGDGSPYLCANSGGSYDWGVMQLNDYSWAEDYDWKYVSWSWRYNIDRGKDIFDWLGDVVENNAEKWPDWTEEEKLDLRTYGYNRGVGYMLDADRDTVYNWPYVTDVRNYEVAKPWLQ